MGTLREKRAKMAQKARTKKSRHSGSKARARLKIANPWAEPLSKNT